MSNWTSPKTLQIKRLTQVQSEKFKEGPKKFFRTQSKFNKSSYKTNKKASLNPATECYCNFSRAKFIRKSILEEKKKANSTFNHHIGLRIGVSYSKHLLNSRIRNKERI